MTIYGCVFLRAHLKCLLCYVRVPLSNDDSHPELKTLNRRHLVTVSTDTLILFILFVLWPFFRCAYVFPLHMVRQVP